MDFFKIIGIAIALAADASIVAFSYGLMLRSRRFANAIKLAVTTGIFQAAMPILGFWLTGKIHKYIEACDHWIAFSVFGALGIIIIFNAWRGNEDAPKDKTKQDRLSLKMLLGIGIATSIDAFAVGAGMACMITKSAENSFWGAISVPAGTIGITTFICVIAAFFSTRIFRRFPKRTVETIAGLILIFLGATTLIQHTCL